jgi:ankyrin repeat protein
MPRYLPVILLIAAFTIYFVIKYFLGRSDRKIVTALRSGDIAYVKKRLLSGLSPTRKMFGDASFLMWACGYAGRPCFEIVKMLIERGADCAVWDEHGQCALSVAAEFGHVDIVGFLLGLGMEKIGGQAALDEALSRAVKGEYGEIVKVLVDHGAKADLAGL